MFFLLFSYHSQSLSLSLSSSLLLTSPFEKSQDTFLGPAMASSALFGLSAYYAPEPRIQQLGTVAAVSMLGILPWTLVALLPINNSLEKMASGDAKALEGKEEEGVEKVKMWRTRHMVRIVLATIGWVAGVAALEIL